MPPADPGTRALMPRLVVALIVLSMHAHGKGGDVVHCGPGFDIACVDGVDNVDPDCESVRR